MKNVVLKDCLERHEIMKILFTILILAVTLFAQNDWKTKDFDKWDKKDVQTILNSSDYVVKQGFNVPITYSTTRIAGATNSRGDDAFTNIGGVSSTFEVFITLRMRSSLAIRLALIRQVQLEIENKVLTKQEREAYLLKQKGLYDCPACKNNYVITINSELVADNASDVVYNSLRNTTFDELKNRIYLQNDQGDKRELVHFVAPKSPQGEAQFFFSKFDDKGNELFTRPLAK
jgi:hypothetical protein